MEICERIKLVGYASVTRQE